MAARSCPGRRAAYLAVNILAICFVERMFGMYMQEQLYLSCSGQFPLLVSTTVAAIIPVALA